MNTFGPPLSLEPSIRLTPPPSSLRPPVGLAPAATITARRSACLAPAATSTARPSAMRSVVSFDPHTRIWTIALDDGTQRSYSDAEIWKNPMLHALLHDTFKVIAPMTASSSVPQSSPPPPPPRSATMAPPAGIVASQPPKPRSKTHGGRVGKAHRFREHTPKSMEMAIAEAKKGSKLWRLLE